MSNRLHHTLIAILLITSAMTFAQEREKDTIDTEVVNVVKAYTPTVSDAFKIKETPNLNDSTSMKKKEIQYNIFSIPVASTFTPAKGKAAGVTKEKPVKLYDNYASLGLGTYSTIVGEVYLNHELSRNERVGGYFSHQSSQGDLDGINYDTDFRDTKLSANYTQQQRDYTWKLEAGGAMQRFNWYGLPDQTLSFFDVGHSFYDANIGGNIDFIDGIFNKGTVLFRRFGDNRNSSENRFLVTSEFDVPVNHQNMSTEVSIDYLSGHFDHHYFSETELNYGNFQLGVEPSYQFIQDDLTLNLGVKLVYLNDTEASKSKFHFYPNVTASYRVMDELLIAFGGIEGGLKQNSYYDFAKENRFIAPTQFIVPTDQSYDVSAGIKGKLSNDMSYVVTAHYQADNNKALFKANPDLLSQRKSYQFGNSFGVVYDDLKTFSFEGELNVDLNRNFKLGAKAAYFAYSTEREAEAWNLPDLKASLFMDYQIDEHWFAGANLFFVGERKDELSAIGIVLHNTLSPIKQTVNLDSYIDANLHAGYKITDQFSAFIKGNNLFNQKYQAWSNYPVQGIQFMAGATYQFDF